LQWAVLLFTCFVGLGLMRQLAFFLAVDERRAPDGLRIGQDVPLRAVPAAARAQVASAGNGDAVSLLVATLVLDSSEGSRELVESVRGIRHRLPCIAVARGLPSDAQEVRAWTGTFDAVVADPTGERTGLLKIDTTPFLLLTDRHFTVRFKVGSSHLSNTLRDWLETRPDEAAELEPAVGREVEVSVE
jgi:hypothetical protein